MTCKDPIAYLRRAPGKEYRDALDSLLARAENYKGQIVLDTGRMEQLLSVLLEYEKDIIKFRERLRWH